MGKILSSFRKSVVDEFVEGISSGSSRYYAFAANPTAYPGSAPDVANTDYATLFENDWELIFGKKLLSSDIAPVIQKNMWASNTVYSIYDNTSNTALANDDFYAISNPTIVGGHYHIYKCIDNANGAVSTVDPGSIGTPTQVSSFTTLADGYRWRYVSSVSAANYDKFASEAYFPVYTNATLSSTASSYSGVEVVMITNAGNNYTAYTNGIIQSVQNSTVIQIAQSASGSDDFYTNSAIYINTGNETTSQLRLIDDYVANGSGKFVYVNTALDTSTITSSVTEYLISPAVIFETDGDSDPKAIAYVNTTSYSIQQITMLDIGTNISWANARIQSLYGSGANIYPIVPPPGGHGFDPITELNVKGMAINFTFANSEVNTIPSSVLYNKIGILKNPNALVSANLSLGTVTKGSAYSANTFNQLLVANVSPDPNLSNGAVVIGVSSGARGTVAVANSTQIQLTGDKYFIDGESIANSIGVTISTITINSVGSIYTKDLKPIYVDNINNVTRANNQTEVFKLTIEI